MSISLLLKYDYTVEYRGTFSLFGVSKGGRIRLKMYSETALKTVGIEIEKTIKESKELSVSEPQENVIPEQNAAPDAQQPQRAQIQIDDSKVMATYANFCRVTGTPEELIIDFGLNPQPIGIPNTPIPVTQRIITNFYTAKRMLHALQMTVQRHEATFGVLEIDVQKRVRTHQ